jgi:hypothetical protein
VLAPAVILLALIGVWITHTVEYMRVGGSAQLAAGMLATVHVYMLPVGAVLATGAALLGMRGWRAWWALGRRLERTRVLLAAALRGRGGAERPAPSRWRRPSEGAQLLALWLPLVLLQVGLYLLQENVESLVAGRVPPGIGAIAGVHAPVLAVHVLVAWALAWVVLLVLRRLAERHDRVVACERLLLAVLGRLGRIAAIPTGARAATPSPLDRFGRGLWRRPPPQLRAD